MINNNYAEATKQDEYISRKNQRNNYIPKHYVEPKSYENMNNNQFSIDEIENRIEHKLKAKGSNTLSNKEFKDKLNYKKEYTIGHEGKYKQKENSIKQDLKFSKDNLDISRDNPKGKQDFKNKVKVELNTEKESPELQKVESYSRKRGESSKSNYEKEEKPLEKTNNREKHYKNNEKIGDKKQGTKTQSKLNFHKENKADKLLYHMDNIDNSIKKVLATSGEIIGISSSKIFHYKMEQVEDENTGVESIHKSQELVESTLRKRKNYSICRRNKKLKREYKEIKKPKGLKDKLQFNKTTSKNKIYQETSGLGMYIQRWKFKRQYNQKTYKTLHQRFLQGIKGNLDTVKEISKRINKRQVYM